MPDNDSWSGILGSSLGPVPFGAKASAMAPNGDVVIAGNVGTGIKVAVWEEANQRWNELGERLRLDGQPVAIVSDITMLANGDVYIVGRFDRAVNGVGMPDANCENIFRWNAGAATPAWEPVGNGLSNSPSKIAVDETNGYVYASGSQIAWNSDGTVVGINNLGRWNVNTNLWETVSTGVNLPITDMALDSNGNLYICGQFTTLQNPDFSNVTVNYVARWDGIGWQPLGQGIMPVNAIPSDLAIAANNDVYFAGFDGVAVNGDGSTVNGPFTFWDGSTWNPLPSLPLLNASEMVIDNNGDIYLLWMDTNFNGSKLEVYDGTGWISIADVQGELVFTIASNTQFNNTRLYYGGLYSAILNPQDGTILTVRNNAYYNGQNWEAMAGAGSSNGRIYSMHIEQPFGNIMAVGGEFSQVGGIDAQNVAQYNGQSWQPLGGGVNGTVWSVHVNRTFIAVGGDFSHAINAGGDSIQVNNLAYFDIATNLWYPAGNGTDGPVYSLWAEIMNLSIGFAGEIIVGGSFTTGFNQNGSSAPLNSLGRFRINPLGDDFWDNPGETDGVIGGDATVYIVAKAWSADAKFYVGGSFNEGRNTNGTTVNSPNILFWDGSDASGWQALGQGTDGIVRDIEHFLQEPAILDNAIWVGGEFQNMFDANGNAVFSRNVGAWYENPGAWTPVAGGTDGPVNAISSVRSYNDEALAVIAGEFTLGYYQNGNARPVENIALFAIGEPAPGLIPNWNQMGDGVDDPVYAVTNFTPCSGAGEHVLIGGDFTVAGDKAALDLAKWRRTWYGGGLIYIGTGSSSGNGGSSSSGRIIVPPCFDINKSGSGNEIVWFDSLEFGESAAITNLSNYRPFDLNIINAENALDTLAQLDSIVIGNGAPQVFILAGVDDPSAYAPNPDGLPTDIQFMALPVAGDSGTVSEVQVVFVNAVTDAPTVDFVVQNGNALATGLSFGSYSDVVMLAPSNYTVEVRNASNQQVLVTFTMDLQNSAGKVLTQVLQGFLDPAANQNGAAMDLAGVDPGVDILTGIGDSVLPPVTENFELFQNYPNPFNPSTQIDFRLSRSATVELKVFNILGQEVELLLNSRMSAGVHSINFDANNLAGGVYFYRLKVGDKFTQTRKMVLLK